MPRFGDTNRRRFSDIPTALQRNFVLERAGPTTFATNHPHLRFGHAMGMFVLIQRFWSARRVSSGQASYVGPPHPNENSGGHRRRASRNLAGKPGLKRNNRGGSTPRSNHVPGNPGQRFERAYHDHTRAQPRHTEAPDNFEQLGTFHQVGP
jgi:hypothetical protein